MNQGPETTPPPRLGEGSLPHQTIPNNTKIALDRPEPTNCRSPARMQINPDKSISDAAQRTISGNHEGGEMIRQVWSSDELLALEQLRLNLRGRHGVAVDRGRIVRAAIAEALADVADNGGESRLIQRLTQP